MDRRQFLGTGAVALASSVVGLRRSVISRDYNLAEKARIVGVGEEGARIVQHLREGGVARHARLSAIEARNWPLSNTMHQRLLFGESATDGSWHRTTHPTIEVVDDASTKLSDFRIPASATVVTGKLGDRRNFTAIPAIAAMFGGSDSPVVAVVRTPFRFEQLWNQSSIGGNQCEPITDRAVDAEVPLACEHVNWKRHSTNQKQEDVDCRTNCAKRFLFYIQPVHHVGDGAKGPNCQSRKTVKPKPD